MNRALFVAEAILPVRFFEALAMGAHSQDWLCHLQAKYEFYGGKLNDLSLVSTQTLTTFVF
jgi:hypothetical protein